FFLSAVLVLAPFVFKVPYYLHLIIVSLIWIIMSEGLNIIQGYTGYVSIAQASFFGIGAYSSALLTTKLSMSFWMALPLSLLIAILFGLVIGYPSLKTRGHYFAIITMAFCQVIFIVLASWQKFTGGESGVQGIYRPEGLKIPLLGEITFNSRENYYFLVLFFVILTIIIVARLVNSRTGRAMVAIRENETLAESLGINIFIYKLTAFVISAAFAGLSGSLYAHYVKFINPSPFGIDNSLNAILVIILGGSGTIAGPVIGSFLLVLLPEMLRVATQFRLVVFGVLLILVTIYMPRGIIYAIANGYRRFPGRKAGSDSGRTVKMRS
ncbi:MAG: branched-chain amino acid ABC transporter permease, partial [Firmicutes bacterium]|nr:branched-chain amino acid ABC transporter permease [Bacillota bacterium]